MDAIFRIEVELDGDSYAIRFLRGTGGRERTGKFFVKRQRVADLRSRMADRLYTDVVSKLRGDQVAQDDWASLSEAVRRLDTMGRALLQAILGSDGTREVAEFLKHEIAFAQKGCLYSHLRSAPVVELHTCVDPRRRHEFSEIIPIEFLPLFGAPDIPNVFDAESLARAMVRFTGMYASVRRSGLWPVDPRESIDAREGLRMKVFVHHGQDDADYEETSFAQLKSSRLVDMDEPWPRRDWIPAGVAPSAAELQLGQHRMIDALFDQLGSVAGKNDTRLDHVHHVFCHADTRGPRFDEHFLRLTARSASDAEAEHAYALGLEEMLDSFSRRLQRGDPVPRAAIIFLNACASLRTDSQCLSSLPGLFLQTHAGVIGTEAKIPTNVAATFSRSFYRFMFAGHDVGQSLHHSRWGLVREFNNPLGILYTLYAKPDLYLQRQAA